ncbi:polyketide synthase [Penicillium freii]|nr:polyketide synthase [Penicillium freii]
MSEIGEEYSAVLQRNFIGREPVKPFFSSVTGNIETIPLDGPYWQKNLESRVLFRTAVLHVLALIENPVFLELGPHSALAGPIRQISAEVSSSAPYVSTMSRGEDCTETFLSAVGKLFELNVPIDFSTIVTGGHCLSDLPPYLWNYETEYWQESRISREWRNREFPSHPLLGVRQLESTSLEPSWRNLLIVDKDCSWLRDHTIENSMIFPCAGYLAMVGEAMRQLSCPHTGLTMRRILISTALLLADTGSTELVTTFRPHRLTDSLQSQWWDFTISSFNGHSWVSHCTGQVMSEAGNPQTAKTDNTPLPRKLEPARYYNFMDTAGLQFGPRFRRLENARCGTEQDSSTADMSSMTIGDEENYHLHPTAVDAVIQSAFFAALKGHPDTTLYRRAPTNIASLTVHQCEPSGDMKILTSATLPSHGGDLVGQAQQVLQNGKIIFHMEGLRMSPPQAAEAADKDISQYPARLTWGPHLDFLDDKHLIQPSLPRDVYTPLLDELAQLCLVYTHRLIKDVLTSVSHMEKYQAWISTQVQSLGESIDPAIAASDDESIMAKIRSLTQTMSDTPVAACAIAMQKVATNISGFLSGQTEALDILLADNTFYEMYGSMDTCDRSEFMKHLAHTKPNLNILEIGAGTGASTVQILKDLTLPGARGFASYGNYTFTDISSGFFVSAKELLKGNNNIEFRTLDISMQRKELQRCLDWGSRDCFICEVDRVKGYTIGYQLCTTCSSSQVGQHG